MQMTKRDIADIVLVWILASVLLRLLTSMAVLAGSLCETSGQLSPVNLGLFLGFEGLYILLLLLLNYVLLFKRVTILSFLFPDAHAKEVAIPAGLEALASFAFWIRLFGIVELLSRGISLVGQMGTCAVFAARMRDDVTFVSQLMPTMTIPNLVGIVVSAAIIWKADWLAEKLTRLGGSNDKASGQMDESRL